MADHGITIFTLDRDELHLDRAGGPQADDQVGGRFRGVQLPIGVFTGMHGPHSAALTRDGTMYITGALSGKLIRFNPTTREWKFYRIPPGFLWRKGLYPHTIRTDRDDNVWFTVTFSNRLAKFDTKTEAFTDIGLPHRGFRRWLEGDAAHAAAFEAMTATWDVTGKMPKKPFAQLSRWQRAGYREGFLRSAAAVAAVAVLAAGVFFYSRDAAIETSVGEQRTLTLEDGSRVVKHACTFMSRRKFRSERRRQGGAVRNRTHSHRTED